MVVVLNLIRQFKQCKQLRLISYETKILNVLDLIKKIQKQQISIWHSLIYIYKYIKS